MKLKKAKDIRRTLRFYKVCYGFREPFKALLDGNFVHACISEKMGVPKEVLPKLLGCAEVKTFVTPCVMSELRGLGDQYRGTAIAARKMHLIKCGHDKPLSAADCILSVTGGGNPEHFFVATQDTRLRVELRRCMGVALVYGSKNGVIMETPSEEQQRFAKMSEADRKHATERELQSRALKPALEVAGGGGGPGAGFKRRKAKGPNPLSMKKKAKAPPPGPGPGPGGGGGKGAAPPPAAGGDGEDGAGGGGRKKRPRVRRRRHARGGEGGPAGQGDE